MADSNKDRAATLIIKKMRGSEEFQDMANANESMMAGESSPMASDQIALVTAAEEMMEAMRTGQRKNFTEALKAFIQMVNDGAYGPNSRV